MRQKRIEESKIIKLMKETVMGPYREKIGIMRRENDSSKATTSDDRFKRERETSTALNQTFT